MSVRACVCVCVCNMCCVSGEGYVVVCVCVCMGECVWYMRWCVCRERMCEWVCKWIEGVGGCVCEWCVCGV